MANYPKYTKEQLSAFDDLPSSVFVNVDNGNGGLEYAYFNPFFAESLGYTCEELDAALKANCFAAIYEADFEKTRNMRAAVMEKGITDSISRQVCKDGTVIWILAHIRRIELDGKFGMLFLFSKIEELIGLQNELSEKNAAWSDILQSVPVGILVYKVENNIRTTLSINRSLIEFANAVGSQLDSKSRSWNEAELAMILNQDIYAFCTNDDIPLVAEMIKNSETQPFTECTFRLRGSSSSRPVFIHSGCTSKNTGENSRTYYVTYQNVTEQEKQRAELVDKQRQLYKMSYFDALTGIKNRNAYNKFAENCHSNRIYDVGFAFCDLNGLKQTNDTLGHYYGDQMLKLFSSILKEFFDPNNIYRLSGDEFIVICPNIDRESFQSKMAALVARVKAEESLASIGYIWKESVSDIQRRTAQAEQVMYVEKQKYYEDTKAVNSKHRPHLLNELLKEFENGRFAMFLQPKTAIDGSRVIGAEALARKYDSDGKLVLPYGFVPQLECEKLISKLDFFMLEQVCKFLQEQHKAGNDDFSISVNMSRVTIAENDYMQTVTEIIGRYMFKHENLEFELTESNKTLDDIKLEEYLIQLKRLGVKISLDDMGNDYSTLSLLTMDGFDWVKLDRSLVIQLDQPKAKILVKHIITTCHDLKLKVIAEGVETDDIRLLLMDMGCDAYQGYLKSKPIPADEFREKFC